VDTSSIEVFANDGDAVLTTLVLPEDASAPIQLWAANNSIVIRQLNVWKLQRAIPIVAR
jgi:sucrose-6-phosphate hydrolase SacC (GH32 family)